jgi:hypothetical protein
MNKLACFILLVAITTTALGQTANDTTSINPKECGLNFTVASTLFETDEPSEPAKRYLSATIPDQRDWGWMVLLDSTPLLKKINKTAMSDYTFSGSLINSRWVLTRAKNAE